MWIGLDRAGNSPLHWACRGGHTEAVQLLLTKNPAINATNKLGDSPLHSAAWAGCLPIVKLLVETPGIQFNSQNKAGETPAQLAKSDEVASLLVQVTGRGLTGHWNEEEEDDD